jgi:putative transposase
LLTVLRYVERNPVRAQLVRRGEQWPWSSAQYWQNGLEGPIFLKAGPVSRPENWLDWVNRPVTAGELEALRRSVNRGTPYGQPSWMEAVAKRLGLEFTLRPRGRPRKAPHR